MKETVDLYARFSDIDQAEAAIRMLRHRCGGVRAFEVRRRRRPEEQNRLLPAAMAFYGANLIGDPSLGPANGAVLLPSLLSRTEAPLIDGPAGREDCLLMVRVVRGQAARAASLLRTCHGSEIFRG